MDVLPSNRRGLPADVAEALERLRRGTPLSELVRRAVVEMQALVDRRRPA